MPAAKKRLGAAACAVRCPSGRAVAACPWAGYEGWPEWAAAVYKAEVGRSWSRGCSLNLVFPTSVSYSKLRPRVRRIAIYFVLDEVAFGAVEAVVEDDFCL